MLRMAAQPEPQIPEITLPWRLRIARAETELDQEPFAKRIGISKRSVVNYEKGHKTPNRPVLLSWALATGVPVEWLMYGTDTGPDDPSEQVIRSSTWSPRTNVVPLYRDQAAA